MFCTKKNTIYLNFYQVNGGINAAMLPIQPPFCDQPPTPWWDNQADVSLLVGTFKHGYERYAVMRLDPSLCFLMRCGPPDKQELLTEMASLEANGDELDKAPDEDDDIDDDSSSTTQGATANNKNSQIATNTPMSAGELNILSIYCLTNLVLILALEFVFQDQEINSNSHLPLS